MKFLSFFKKNKQETIQLKKTVDIDPLMHWKNIVLILLAIVVTTVTMLLLLVYSVDRGFLINKASKLEVEELKLSQFKIDELGLLIDMFKAREEVRSTIIDSFNKTNIPVAVPPNNIIN